MDEEERNEKQERDETNGVGGERERVFCVCNILKIHVILIHVILIHVRYVQSSAQHTKLICSIVVLTLICHDFQLSSADISDLASDLKIQNKAYALSVSVGPLLLPPHLFPSSSSLFFFFFITCLFLFCEFFILFVCLC